MGFTSATGAVPKGYGFVVKPSLVGNALKVAGVEIDAHLIRRHSMGLFVARFWPPNPNVPYDRLYMTSGTARALDLHELRRRVELEALPHLVRWISGMIALDPRSPIRRESQSIDLLPFRSVGI
jgi:hypothetical protein